MTSGGCTSLDHIYPIIGGTVAQGTPCYCGARTWGGAPRKVLALKAGASVVIAADTERTVRIVLEKLRAEDAYRVDQSWKGRTLFERSELEVQ